MKHTRLRILFMILLSFAELCLGQEVIHFQHIGINEGLSQSDVNTIYQDKLGFLWFGTHDGLNKYDGYKFTNYLPNQRPNSISSNLIFSITGDSNNNLWIGSTGSGLNFFNRETGEFTVLRHNAKDPNSLSSDHIIIVYLDSKDRLWVGTDNGLNMMDLSKPEKERNFKRFTALNDPLLTNWKRNSVFSIYEDSQKRLLVGGSGGIYELSKNKEGELYFILRNKDFGIPNENVRCIVEQTPGYFIIGMNHGLYYKTPVENSPNSGKIAEGSFNSLITDKNGQIWAGSDQGLLHITNHKSTQVPRVQNTFVYNPNVANSISKNIITSLLLDATGIIWVGTNGGGVNKLDLDRKPFRHIKKTQHPNSLSYDKIRSFLEDSNGALWVGTEGGGINRLPRDKNNGDYTGFTHFKTPQKPFSLAEIKENNRSYLLVGAAQQPYLYKLDITEPKKIKETDFKNVEGLSNSVFAILEDDSKMLWIGTYGGGLERWIPNATTDGGDYNKQDFVYNPASINGVPSNIIRSIFQDEKGSLWFGTANGLARLSPKEALKETPKFDVFQHDKNDTSSLSHNYILPIFESSSGQLWVGTLGGGLNKYIPGTAEEKGKFISYNTDHGLANNVIKGILEDENGNLWLSSNQGLSKFDPVNETFLNYDVFDGLQSSEFQELACLKRSNGEMLFGGVNGYNAFYPADISTNTTPPETVITDFLIANTPVEIGVENNGHVLLEKSIEDTKEIALKFNENNFSFEFAALHYEAPGKNQFEYMLEGFDNDWIKTSSEKRFATYTNLEPDTYTMKVRASNNDGVWDPTPTEIELTVLPPWWRTVFAKIFYILAIMGLFWLFWRYTFIRTSRKHQLELEHMEKEKKEELQRIKLDFFTNISHELRTPLTLIKGPLEYLRKSGAKIDPKKVQEQYGLMQKNTDYLLRLVTQLLDFRKINQGKMHLVVRHSNIVSFIKEVAEPFQFLAHKQSIAFTIEYDKAQLLTWFDHGALEKIINNLLSNAFKFTPEFGTIGIEISEEKNVAIPNGHSSVNPITDYITLKVMDSGPGISQNKTGKIFERYFKDDDQHKNNPKGIGIGLSFTKSLIELHRGTIEVSSEINQGTFFEVKLPKNQEAYVNRDDITVKATSDNDYLVRSSETESFAIDFNDDIYDENLLKTTSDLPTLLVVDDNPDIRVFIKSILSEEYTIHEAQNGQEGLEVANRIIPSVVISDILMPVMDGLELCKKLKSQPDTSHIPVILLTAKASQESELKGLQFGADDYLKKPFDMELLQLKLSNIINYRKQLRERYNKEIILQPKEVTVTSTDELFLQSAMDIVEKHMTNTDFNVEMLVQEIGHSRSKLYLKFKELTGLSSSEFIRSIRLKRAVQLLEDSDLSVKEIMYMTGFNTASYFSKCFKKQFGVIPSEYVSQKKPEKTL